MRIVIGISGATGVIYGIRLLELLAERKDIETHLVISRPAKETIALETDYSYKHVESMANFVYSNNQIGASIASGSFKTDGMVVVPCSIKTLSGISNSYNENLLIRAADVTLKDRRRLVLVVRETPLHVGHLRLMTQAAEMGAIIMPPVPAFYTKPKTIDDIINQTIGRVLDLLGIDYPGLFPRWCSPSFQPEN